MFSLIVLICCALYWLVMLLTRSRNIDAYFVTDHWNTSMDYFNMLSNLNYGDPWYADANYPAIVFVFFKIMHRFVPISELGDGFYLRENMISQLGYILFVAICLVIIWETVKYLSVGCNGSKILFACALLFSGPMFFLLERGNILLAVLAFSLLFLAFYDSDKMALRIVAYVALAVAAAIKIYPALLGLLVLSKKRYKEAAVLVGLGIVFFFVPFFVFDGITSVKKMLHGIVVASEIQTGIGLGYNFCINNLVQIIGAFFGRNIVSVPGWISLLAAAACLLLFIFSKHEWQKLYALILLCIWFPSFSYTYTLVLLFLPIISFFRSEPWQQGRFRFLYVCAFVLLMIPYALPMVETVNNALGMDYVKFPVSWGMVIVNAALVVVAGMIAVESVMDLWNHIENKK